MEKKNQKKNHTNLFWSEPNREQGYGDEFLTFDTVANKRDDVKEFKTVSVKRYIRQ